MTEPDKSETDISAENHALRQPNEELRLRNRALHNECHALRMRLNYPLAVSDEETKAELR